MPLPPYIKRPKRPDRALDAADRDRYQTVYAAEEGAVAAPTAGLHFTEELMQRVREKGADIAEVTLHVGAGTFLPVKVEDTDEHKMHSEWGTVEQPAPPSNAPARTADGSSPLEPPRFASWRVQRMRTA